MPRPRLDDRFRRTQQVGVRLRPAEAADIAKAARRVGRRPADWVREVAVAAARDGARPDEPDLSLMKELAEMRTALVRLGVSLNQIARKVNRGEAPTVGAYLTLLIDIQREVARAATKLEVVRFTKR